MRVLPVPAAVNDLAPIEIPDKPKRKRSPSVAKLKARIEALEGERDTLRDRCKLAEHAACANLGYAQAARSAMEELAEMILARLPPLPSDTQGKG
jgi:hypothetical protein